MRLTPLIEGADGRQRCRIPLAAQLQILRQQDVAIAIGRYTGAAPLPAMSTVRVQLVDLLASRSEEHTSELQSLMRISYAVFCLKKKKNKIEKHITLYI